MNNKRVAVCKTVYRENEATMFDSVSHQRKYNVCQAEILAIINLSTSPGVGDGAVWKK